MPYNPGIQYQGGQLFAQGLAGLGAGIGRGLEQRAERKEQLKKQNNAAKGMRLALTNLNLIDKEDADALDFNGLSALVGLAPLMADQPEREIRQRGMQRAEDQEIAADDVVGKLGENTGDRAAQQKIIDDSAGTVGANNYFRFHQFIQDAGTQGLRADIMKAQLDNTVANTGRLEAEMEAIHADRTSQLPEAQRGEALKLGAELRSSAPVKDFLSGKGALESLKYNLAQGASAEGRTPADDMALVFQFMKTLDPGSTVREGEFQLAESAGSAVTQFKNTWDKIFTGTRLQPEQVNAVIHAAENAVEGLASAANESRKMIAGQGAAVGVDPKFFAGDVFSAYPIFATQEEADKAGVPPGQKVWIDGKLRRRKKPKKETP